ncbi:LON-domain-containing protein [Rickenella mellea]|uniref:LON-domain-containing protein n=1 Tax=Rickenella mellea TaxID=50990 RepID=A0A4Y7QI27_9AGAM|nr:LON-domain-containing protein [Rickenella mellea]
MATPYLPLLHCPLCPGSSLLSAPTTLHCGHTLCSSHVRRPSHSTSISSNISSSPSRRQTRQMAPPPSPVPTVAPCPLPTCRPGRNLLPNIPPDSPVAYYPPIAPSSAIPMPPTLPDQPELSPSANPRVDVSVSRVITLMHRPEYAQNHTEFVPTFSDRNDLDSEDDDDTDTYANANGSEPDKPASTLPQSRSDLPSRPSFSAAERRTHSNRDSPTEGHVRPQKRQRRLSDSTPPKFTLGGNIEERFHKELLEHLTCEICFMLLYQPITTPCQHTFCAKCLQRSLDHQTKCPLCRQDLPAFNYFQDHPYNKVLLSILLKAAPDVYTERGRAIEAEERDARLDTPIFVCQLSFPGMPTLLHFFEPRYRLMLRRCLESPTPRFGMVMAPRSSGNVTSNDYGTMLEIRSVQMLPDGRSMVETWGSYRFRILERGVLDGYMVGRIERIDDIPLELEEEAHRCVASLDPLAEVVDPSPPPGPETASSSTSRVTRMSLSPRPSSTSSAPVTSSSTATASAPRRSRSLSPSATVQASNDELLAVCHAFLDQLRNGTAPWVVQRLNNTYGPMPTDPSSFSFWMALVLPIEEHEKAKLLPIKSARLRLRLVVHWIEQLNSNW